MILRVRCNRCGVRFQLRSEWAGKRGECPNPECRHRFRVPEFSADSLGQAALANEAGDAFELPEEADDFDSAFDTPPPRKRVRRGAGAARAASGKAVRPVAKRKQSAGAALPPSPVRRTARKRGRGRSQRRLKPMMMIGGGSLGIIVLVILLVNLPTSVSTPEQQLSAAEAPTVAPYSEIQPFFEKYCFDCHAGEYAEEGLALDSVKTADDLLMARKRWEKVLQLVEVGAMPPSDVDQPTQEEREKVSAWLKHTLFYVDCDANPDPGRVTIRRLNRTEYNNTVRDLIGVDFQPADDFPSDDVGYGFDNIGDVLTVPPLLVEKYLDAAEQITAKAILTENPNAIELYIPANKLSSEGAVHDRGDTQALVSRGVVFTEPKFGAAGEYEITIEAMQDQAGDEDAKMEVAIDGNVIKTFEVTGHRDLKTYTLTVNAEAGKRRLSARFLNDYYNEKARRRKDRNLYVGAVTVTGPKGLPTELPESHQRLVAVTPGEGRSVDDAARVNLEPFLRRAFRRTVTPDEVAQYAKLVQMTVDHGDSFERGMQIAVQAALCSPQFLFRVESDKRMGDPNARHSLDDFELASRLSYFLWSSMPDDELLDLAERGELKKDEVLRQQAARMLAHEKADALIENFSGQWLGLRKLTTNEVEPDPDLFPEFDDELRMLMWKETELFFGHIVRNDRPITELLTARYSFLNERLAKLYGIGGVKGEEFRRVELGDEPRSGLLTHASILTLTSYPDRTSPVKRGEWVLANLLGDAPPDPPPSVPSLEETSKSHPDLSMREQLVLHREDPVCASCHKVMDEIGFGLENFDAIGRWRDKEGKHPVDAQGTLPTGESFEGPLELVTILQARNREFTKCVTEKLLTYGLGRGLEYYDSCAVEEIVGQVEEKGHRFSALVMAIVMSEPFRMRGEDVPSKE